MLTVTQAAILGAVQGLTEFLPVSSSAHLVVVPWALNWPSMEQQMAFDVALHIGTLLAVFLFFFFEWALIIATYIGDLRQKNWKGSTRGSLLPKIIVASIPAAIVGKLFEHRIEEFFYKHDANIWFLAVTMVLFGTGLLLAEKFAKTNKDEQGITYQDALIIGCFQCLALIPGTSRSGITILAALLLGLRRPAAAKFSFLAALPITFGACMLQVRKLENIDDWTPLIVGVATAAIVGMIAIKGLLKYVQNRSYTVFALYRYAFAIVLLALYFSRNPIGQQ